MQFLGPSGARFREEISQYHRPDTSIRLIRKLDSQVPKIGDILDPDVALLRASAMRSSRRRRISVEAFSGMVI